MQVVLRIIILTAKTNPDAFHIDLEPITCQLLGFIIKRVAYYRKINTTGTWPFSEVGLTRRVAGKLVVIFSILILML